MEGFTIELPTVDGGSTIYNAAFAEDGGMEQAQAANREV
jgi:hypothetical protein